MTNIERLIATLSPAERDRLEDDLDEQVHDAKPAEGAAINNAGIVAQAAFLGLTHVNLLALLDTPGGS